VKSLIAEIANNICVRPFDLNLVGRNWPAAAMLREVFIHAHRGESFAPFDLASGLGLTEEEAQSAWAIVLNLPFLDFEDMGEGFVRPVVRWDMLDASLKEERGEAIAE